MSVLCLEGRIVSHCVSAGHQQSAKGCSLCWLGVGKTDKSLSAPTCWFSQQDEI